MSSNKSPNALRTIGEVAEDIGVATHVLRFWEGKFNQIKPQKRRGRRYYRPEDIRIITQIKALLYGQGYTIRGVQKFLAEESKNKSAKQNTLSNMVADEKIEQKPTQEVKQEPDFDKFKTDLFGNIVPENEVKIEAPAAAPVQPIEISAATEKPEIANTGKVSERLNSEQMAQLEVIYNAFLNAREKLHSLG